MPHALQRAQLDAIAQFDAICRSLDVAAWLRGRWAMDFCLGRITRPHEDVDWYVRDGDAVDIVAALTEDGWALSDRIPIERQANLVRHGVELSFNPVRIDAAARPVLGSGPWEGEPLPPDMLDGAGRGTLERVTASYISPMALIQFKLMTPVWRPEFFRRDKDEVDVALLCRHFFDGNERRRRLSGQ